MTKLLEKYLININDDNIHSELIKFFINNPNPSDDQIHNFAGELGIEHKILEEKIYSLLTDFIKGIGKHKDIDDSKYDQKELKMGKASVKRQLSPFH